MRRSSLFALALIACASLPLHANDGPDSSTTYDWPQFRGPNRDGISKETGLLKEWPKGGPKLLWNSKDVNGQGVGIGIGSVSIAKGRLYVMGDHAPDCFVFCLDAKTGKQIWATKVGASQKGTNDDPGPRCTPTIDGDRIYVLHRKGMLACLDTAKGEILWHKDLKKDFDGKSGNWDYSESPLIDGDRLLCTPGGDKASMVALDKKTGATIWKCPISNIGRAGYASIVTAEVGGIKQYITVYDRALVGVSADGKLLWRYEKVANSTAPITTSIVKGDLVFCSTSYGKGAGLVKLEPDGKGGVTAKEQYYLPANKLNNHHGGMVLLGDYVYGGHDQNNGHPFCIEMKSGKFAWGPEKKHPGSGSGAVIYADGMLYFRWQNGTMGLVEASPGAFKVVSTFNLPKDTGTPSWPHPAICNGRLYIRGADCLLCYDIKNR